MYFTILCQYKIIEKCVLMELKRLHSKEHDLTESKRTVKGLLLNYILLLVFRDDLASCLSCGCWPVLAS